MKKLLLFMSVLFAMNISAQNCSELFFSEYVEGTDQSKAIEIYNPTSNAIDLSDYQVERYSNGSTNSAAGGITILSGMLAPGDVFVLTHGDTVNIGYGAISMTLYNMGDMAEPPGAYPTPMHMNGNDAIVLSKNGAIIDVFGRVGEDPGLCWTDDASAGYTDAGGGNCWTKDHTLIRKLTVLNGDDNGLDLFNPTLEWDILPIDTWNNLGSHQCDCYIYGCTDSIACNYDASATIDDGSCVYSSLNIDSLIITEITCYGADNAGILVLATGGYTPYLYSNDNGAITQSNIGFSNLGPNTYIMYVEDALGCVARDTVEIVEPDLLYIDDVVFSNVSCYGLSNGAIQAINGVGGTLPYEYSVGTGPHYPDTWSFNGYGPGTYTVNIFDSNNCANQYQITITEPLPGSCSGCTDSLALNYDPTATIDDGSCTYCNLTGVYMTIVDASCFGYYDGSVTIDSVQGAFAPLTFTWNPPVGTDSTISSLYAGSYAVAIGDSFGCMITANAQVGQPDELYYTTYNVVDESIVGACDGQIWVDVQGGTWPYYYDGLEVGTFPIPSANQVQLVNDSLILNLCTGLHSIYITDDHNCPGVVLPGGTYEEFVSYSAVSGCTDSLACNYDASATIDDGSCLTVYGCIDSTALNYQASANCDDGSCAYPMTYVPDDNFENYLEVNGMGDGIALNDSVLTAHINTVTSLYVNNLNIADLTGIEDFTALINLDCEDNQLSSLDVSNNTALTSLKSRYNQLTSLDISNNTALTYLECDVNHLTSLDVSNNTSLTSLSCSVNQLTSLDVSNNTALIELDCFQNQLISLDVSNNTSLTALSTRENLLTALDVSQNTNLIGLGCDDNQLTSLDVSDNTVLEALECFYNQLTSLDLSNNTALVELYCFDNQLISLDLSNNTALTWLECDDNQLTGLDLRNGNNTNMNISTIDNTNLTCIDVDDATWSTTNWTNIDPWASFSANCSGASIYGCTDSLACNYNASANLDDGSCAYTSTSTDTQAHCDTYTWLDGTTYITSNNTATWTSTNAAGCDNVATLNLTINNSTTSTDTQVHCDSYTWLDGITYITSNNTATWTSTNAAGCDNVATLDLTINNSTSSFDTLSVTASIVWNGMPLNVSGDYSATLINSVGCDSITNLNLTVSTTPTWDCVNGVCIDLGTGNGQYSTLPACQIVCNVNAIDDNPTIKRKLKKITDMLGQETLYRRNTTLFYIYDDGTVEKKIVIE